MNIDSKITNLYSQCPFVVALSNAIQLFNLNISLDDILTEFSNSDSSSAGRRDIFYWCKEAKEATNTAGCVYEPEEIIVFLFRYLRKKNNRD